MSKIYVVTTGQYSDYSIEAVFSSVAKAQKYCRYHNPYQENGLGEELKDCDYRIAEYDLDPETPNLPKDAVAFEVQMRRDGGTQMCSRIPFSCLAARPEVILYMDWMCTNVLARDEKHAVKIANERRTAVIALDKWSETRGEVVRL
jgi:hypothetical protein